jgi:predicted MPP superfamily phosphohydrolase
MDGRVDAYSHAAEPLKLLHQRATTVMVIGNHDHMHGDIDYVVRLMESLGIIVLRNEGMYVKKLRIIGLDDIAPDISMTSQAADLILVHQPSVGASIQAKTNKNALILAGHTHCGQMLPAIPVIWAANAAYFCGVYGNMYVSSGSGQWGPTMRFFWNRAEVAVHKL